MQYPKIRPRKGQSELGAWIHEVGYCRFIIEYMEAGKAVAGASGPESTVDYWKRRLARAQKRLDALVIQVPA